MCHTPQSCPLLQVPGNSSMLDKLCRSIFMLLSLQPEQLVPLVAPNKHANPTDGNAIIALGMLPDTLLTLHVLCCSTACHSSLIHLICCTHCCCCMLLHHLARALVTINL